MVKAVLVHSTSCQRPIRLSHGDVLEVYTRPYDGRFPQVCMDEPDQMYNLFLACEPLAGKRVVMVTEHHTS